MAEVPEVETLVRDLQQAVVGRRFTGAESTRRPASRSDNTLARGKRTAWGTSTSAPVKRLPTTCLLYTSDAADE